VESFRNLKVWQRAPALTVRVYRLAATLPDFERFGLAAQMRSAAASIGGNIAEGCGRRNSRVGNGDLIRSLYIAMGEATELEYWLLLTRDVGRTSDAAYSGVLKDVVEYSECSVGSSPASELDRFRRRRRPSQAHKPTSPQAHKLQAPALTPRAD
jgi:four helix bundle protein